MKADRIASGKAIEVRPADTTNANPGNLFENEFENEHL